MSRPMVPGASAHRSQPVSVQPDPVLALACATLGAGGVMGSAARLLAPQLRGRVSSRTLRALEGRGLRVHRVGAAAYVHGSGHHLILAVWDRGDPIPTFAARLGRASEGYRRRVERLAREGRTAELARIRGRFASRLPWWRLPVLRVYRWDPEPGTWQKAVERRAMDHNHALRLRAGLVWAVER